MMPARALASLCALMTVALWCHGSYDLSPLGERTLDQIAGQSSLKKPNNYTCSYEAAGAGQATCDGCAGVPNSDYKACVCCANDQMSQTDVLGGTSGIKSAGANVTCAGNIKSVGTCYSGSCYSRTESGMCVDPKTPIAKYTNQ